MQQSEFLKTALEAARAAEEVIRHYWHEGATVNIKKDETPVTQADVKAEEVIKSVIMDRFPSHGFWGEETGKSQQESDYLWLIDPIDGTKSFIRHTPFFSTQIALRCRDQWLLGVSNAPLYNELMWAEVGSGAYLNGAPVRCGSVQDLSSAALSLGNIKTLSQNMDGWEVLRRIVSKVNRTRGYGDFCHYHMLASGKLDLVIESDVNILDVAALQVIVHEAGGKMTTLKGEALDYDSQSILATGSSELHQMLLDYFEAVPNMS